MISVVDIFMFGMPTLQLSDDTIEYGGHIDFVLFVNKVVI